MESIYSSRILVTQNLKQSTHPVPLKSDSDESAEKGKAFNRTYLILHPQEFTLFTTALRTGVLGFCGTGPQLTLGGRYPLE